MKKSKRILIPLIVGCLIFGSYYIFSNVHTYLWLAYIFSYGIWFSVILLKFSEYSLTVKYGDKSILFYAAGCLLYIFTLVYFSQNFELALSFRRITFLVFNGLGYFILFKWLLKIDVRISDFLLVVFYGILVAYCFTDLSYYTLDRLDLLIATWSTLLLLHLSLILAKRKEINSTAAH